MRSNHNRQHGFTLIELMVTIAIVAIIAAIAIPSYSSFQKKSRRGEAKAALIDVAARLEEHYSENKEYTQNLDLLGLAAAGATEIETVNKHYKIRNSESDSTTYYLYAVPQGSQASDGITYNLNDNGVKEHRYGAEDADPDWP